LALYLAVAATAGAATLQALMWAWLPGNSLGPAADRWARWWLVALVSAAAALFLAALAARRFTRLAVALVASDLLMMGLLMLVLARFFALPDGR
jgi:hypothetical protein